MATSTGPNLASAVKAVNALMDDTCIIELPGSIETATLDQTTGVLTPAAPTRIYSGRCKIRQRSSTIEDLAGRERTHAEYEGSIPLGSKPLEVGMTWTHTSSRRDPQLVDRRFEIKAVYYTSFAVQRRVELVEI